MKHITIVALMSSLAASLVPANSQPTTLPKDEVAPTAAGARFPAFARASDGSVAMVWTERGADSVALVKMATRSTRGSWSPAHTVTRDSTLFVNFADAPKIAYQANGHLLVSWLQKGGAGKYDYGVRLARSSDGGKTWTPVSSPHALSEKGEHGFVSMVSMPGVGIGLSYLNGSSHGTPDGGTRVDFATVGATGTVSAARTVDSRACDCCQTAAANTSRGVIVAFRDRTSDEIRDISISRLAAGAWTPAVPVTHDRWKINACPVNGPALAANDERVALTWFAAPHDSGKVQLAFSTDAGVQFGKPIRIDAGAPAGHVDVSLSPDGFAWVSWLERANRDQFEIRVRSVSKDGALAPPVVLDTVTGLRPTGWPAMIAVPDGLLLAWTVPGKPTTIRLRKIPQIAR